MPHVPIFASDRFKGKSATGLYGDVIEEIDWSVGEIVGAIDRHGLTENTLVIFCNDNGPFLSYGKHAGSAGPLREGKLTAFDGGVCVPTIMRWPGKITAGRQCDTPLMTIDFLPTLCSLVGAELPANPIDGVDVSEVLLDQTKEEPHQFLAFYSGTELHAVRMGQWKLHFPHPYLTVIEGEPRNDGKPSGFGTLTPKSITESGVEGIASRHGYRVAQLPLSLYDLANDEGEQTDVSASHPEIVAKLTLVADSIRRDLGDSLTGVDGKGNRPSGNNGL
jgi:hypothetical protein